MPFDGLRSGPRRISPNMKSLHLPPNIACHKHTDSCQRSVMPTNWKPLRRRCFASSTWSCVGGYGCVVLRQGPSLAPCNFKWLSYTNIFTMQPCAYLAYSFSCISNGSGSKPIWVGGYGCVVL